jgi:hypothetical protein
MEDGLPHASDDLPPTADSKGEEDSAELGPEGEPLTRQDSGQPLYLPLIDGHIIRLIELQPGEPDDQVQLRLLVVELEFAPDYEAISYVWGDPNDTARIQCNGRDLFIPVNLHAALVRLRHTDRKRILWADAICINQGHERERSHQVTFMNLIYQHAARVLICFGQDPDGGANDIPTLIQEHNLRRAEYDSVDNMSILLPDDPLYDDPRWKSLAVLMRRPWFTRAWVLQEAGVAKDPWALYGDTEFRYRDLIQLAKWVVRCAPNLQTKVGFHYGTIQIDWEDWSPDWQTKGGNKNYTLLDFLGHARGLLCSEPKDHIYAFLGHPLAQTENGDIFLTPDYTKDTREVFLELSTFLIGKFGFRALSAVEHDESTITDDFPSWVFRWDAELVQNSFGVYTDYYFCASAGIDVDSPLTIEGRELKLQGILMDVVSKSYKFSTTSEDLETPKQLRTLKPPDHKPVSLDRIWTDLNVNETPRIYDDGEWLDAFSLTLCSGLMGPDQCAQDDLQRHRANFAAYWKLRLQSTSIGEIPAELEATKDRGDEERFYIDMSLACEGRSFLITQKGHYGLGPWIAEPGDKCFILLGCRVPFILRETNRPSYYKLVGEAYIHGAMRGELNGPQGRQGTQAETIFIC